MKKMLMFFILMMTTALIFGVEVYAQLLFGGNNALQYKLGNLQNVLIGTFLPIISTIGLVYAAMLSITGSGEGRGKIIGVVVMAIIGFMAKYIIQFFQQITG